MKIVVVKRILGDNDRRAAALRRKFRRAGTLAVNLISSPGSGKTALIERLVPELRRRGVSVAVIEGDVATTNDAERVEAAGAPAVQVTTSGVCHLNAAMVAAAVRRLEKLPQILFIENVGNLVCPAAFDVGEAERLVLVSLPEGDDKPEKYPEAFAGAGAMVINKTDLAAGCRFRVSRAVLAGRSVNPRLAVFETSCRSGGGIRALAGWLVARREERFGLEGQAKTRPAKRRRAPRRRK
jgi:hydrogenase nickel incorporation protein HypB